VTRNVIAVTPVDNACASRTWRFLVHLFIFRPQFVNCLLAQWLPIVGHTLLQMRKPS